MNIENNNQSNPIEAAGFLHEALRTAANQVKQISDQLGTVHSLQGLTLAFTNWVTVLIFNMAQQENHIEPSLRDALSKEDSNKEQKNGSIILALSRVGRQEQMSKIEDVFSILYGEIGDTSLITRTAQHLQRQILDMEIAQTNHLETQDLLIIPILANRMDSVDQLSLLKNILIDEQSDDRRWIVDWISEHSNPSSKSALAEIESQLADM